jgi:hypothetical protein
VKAARAKDDFVHHALRVWQIRPPCCANPDRVGSGSPPSPPYRRGQLAGSYANNKNDNSAHLYLNRGPDYTTVQTSERFNQVKAQKKRTSKFWFSAKASLDTSSASWSKPLPSNLHFTIVIQVRLVSKYLLHALPSSPPSQPSASKSSPPPAVSW